MKFWLASNCIFLTFRQWTSFDTMMTFGQLLLLKQFQNFSTHRFIAIKKFSCENFREKWWFIFVLVRNECQMGLLNSELYPSRKDIWQRLNSGINESRTLSFEKWSSNRKLCETCVEESPKTVISAIYYMGWNVLFTTIQSSQPFLIPFFVLFEWRTRTISKLLK